MILNFLGPIFEKVLGIVDEVVEDKDEANRLKSAIQMKMLQKEGDFEQALIKAKSDIIVSESKGNWYVSSWRPTLMYVIIAILALQFLIIPLLMAFGFQVAMITLPDALYTLLTVSVGGYIAGRSGQGIAQTLANKQK